ncbi:hypothetical protein BV20DRAFT_297984 [Pilatotrama ljubarskyi]|nr:hypothetical protein BV20DRAFT_297984 [Pilatotrama ljubarskyi]
MFLSWLLLTGAFRKPLKCFDPSDPVRELACRFLPSVSTLLRASCPSALLVFAQFLTRSSRLLRIWLLDRRVCASMQWRISSTSNNSFLARSLVSLDSISATLSCGQGHRPRSAC